MDTLKEILKGFKPEFGNQSHITIEREVGKYEKKMRELELLEAREAPVSKIIKTEKEVEVIIRAIRFLLKK